jgi:hypothetical protein
MTKQSVFLCAFASPREIFSEFPPKKFPFAFLTLSFENEKITIMFGKTDLTDKSPHYGSKLRSVYKSIQLLIVPPPPYINISIFLKNPNKQENIAPQIKNILWDVCSIKK